jgi:hypothetical protein
MKERDWDKYGFALRRHSTFLKSGPHHREPRIGIRKKWVG